MSSCLVGAWRTIFLEVSFIFPRAIFHWVHAFFYPCMLLTFPTKYLWTGSAHFLPLSWGLRMKIALGAAKGLAFLHSDEARVIYRDFKTSNILLDVVCELVLVPYDVTMYKKDFWFYWILVCFCELNLTELQCKTIRLWVSQRWTIWR